MPCLNSHGTVVGVTGRQCTVGGYGITYDKRSTTTVTFLPSVAGKPVVTGKCLLDDMTSNGQDYQGRFSNFYGYTNATDTPTFAAICGVSLGGYAGHKHKPTQSEYALSGVGAGFAQDIAFSIGMCDVGMEVPPSDALFYSCKDIN